MSEIITQGVAELYAKAVADRRLFSGFGTVSPVFTAGAIGFRNPPAGRMNVYILHALVYSSGVSSFTGTIDSSASGFTTVFTTIGPLHVGSGRVSAIELSGRGTSGFPVQSQKLAEFRSGASDEAVEVIPRGTAIYLRPQNTKWGVEFSSTLGDCKASFVWAEFPAWPYQ